jgi:hypothetical protein
MQAFFQIVLTLDLFFLCINLGLYMANSAFFPDEANSAHPVIPQAVNFTQLNENSTAIADSFEGGGGFNTAFIFGDFGRAITVFFQMVSGGYIVDTLNVLGFPGYFTVALQAIVGTMTIGALVYLVSGRF